MREALPRVLNPITANVLQVKRPCDGDQHVELALYQEPPKDQGREVVETNLVGKGEEAQPIFLNASLAAASTQILLDLPREFKDVFAWT